MTTAAAAAKKLDIVIERLSIEGVRPSPSNPRKSFKAIDDLAEHIKEHGVLEPLLVRPIAAAPNMSAHHEIVKGERRWRAAKKAGLSHVPALVQELTDVQALELMLVELAQRSDVNPIEEAEAYRELHTKHKLSVEEIALKVGKSKGVIYERLKLCELAEPVKKAALAGEITPSVAVLIARVANPKLQEEALKRALGDRWSGPPSFQEMREIIHREFTTDLGDAPWDLKDSTLVPTAGSCSACPKRTGNQPELFSDVKAKDTCTDPACFTSKKQAFATLKVKKAEADGQKVLKPEEAKKLFERGVGNSGYVDLDEHDYSDPKSRTWREKLGKKAPPAVLAVDGQQQVRELVPKDEVKRALPKKEAPQSDAPSQETQQRQRLELRKAVVAAALAPFVAAAKKQHERVLKEIVRERVSDAEPKVLAALAPLFGVAADKEGEALEKALLAAVTGPDLPALLYALDVVPTAAGGTWGLGYGGGFEEACEMLRVDLKKIEATEKARRQAAKKEKKKGKAATSAQCAVPGCINATHKPLTKNHGVFWCSIHAKLPPAERIVFANATGKAPVPAGKACAVPGCGEGIKAKGFCVSHFEKLSAVEQKSILDRNKRLAAEGKLPTQRIVKLPAKKKGGKK